MQSNKISQLPVPVDLKKQEIMEPHLHLGDSEAVEPVGETPAKILIADGVPAWIGGSAAMAVAGAPLVPALAIGLFSGLAFTLLRARHL
jgi:hypothetical protein